MWSRLDIGIQLTDPKRLPCSKRNFRNKLAMARARSERKARVGLRLLA